MASIISPNMNLIIPTVGSESGPQYAFDVNNSLNLIDQHDHSAGKGVQITPAGMDINTALPFNSNPATSLSYLNLVALSSATAVTQAISVAPASSINELWYTDSNGTQTQITKNGQVNATASSIPGESYNAGTFIWTQTQSSLPTTPANFDIGSITIRPNTAGTTNGVQLQPPGAISSSYTLQLPQRPVSNPAFLTVDTSGNMLTTVSTVQGITASNIANQTITATQIANQTITATQIANSTITPTQMFSTGSNFIANSSSSGNFSSAVVTDVVVTGVEAGIGLLNTNRPSFIFYQSGSVGIVFDGATTALATFKTWQLNSTSLTSVTSSNVYIINTVGTTSASQWHALGLPGGLTPAGGQVFTASTSSAIPGTGTVVALGNVVASFTMVKDFTTSNNGENFQVPCGSLNCLDAAPSASFPQYVLTAAISTLAGPAADVIVTGVQMVTFQV